MSLRTTATLQRKCACGKNTSGGEQCEDCKKKKLQRRAIANSRPAIAPPIVHDVLRSPGQPLDKATRNFMEPRFGQDFSQVRVHADAKAAESARAVNARAYTVGADVVFGPGQYRPSTNMGSELVAHELAHVVQQHREARLGEFSPPEQIVLGSVSDSFEAEAEAAGKNVANRTKPPLRLGTPDLRLQRAPMNEDQKSRGRGGTLAYRQATALQGCIKIRGEENAESCRKEVMQASGRDLQPGATGQLVPEPSAEGYTEITYGDKQHKFSARLDRSECLLRTQKRIYFDFMDEPPNYLYKRTWNYSPWKDSQKQEFQTRFIRGNQERWSGKYKVYPAAPCASERCKEIGVLVEVLPVEESKEHLIVHVANFSGDPAFREPPHTGALGAELQSIDVNPSTQNGLSQVKAEHEFGHMLGLNESDSANCKEKTGAEECYGKPGSPEEKDIMGKGSEISAQDYAPFVYALEQKTHCKWQTQNPGEKTQGLLGDLWDFVTKNPLGRGLALGAIGAGIGALAGGGLGALVGGGIGLATGLGSGLFF